jgi:hypothetical protein
VKIALIMAARSLKRFCLYDIFSTYTLVPGSVSNHNLRTVAPRYGELLALLVYLYIYIALLWQESTDLLASIDQGCLCNGNELLQQGTRNR